MSWFDYVGLAELQEEPRETEAGKHGLTVTCRPDTDDPQVVQQQGRASCLFRPYEACHSCPHSTFVLAFEANKEARLEQVACPRWESRGGREQGKPPDKYVATEVATCRAAPFEFCSSCPSREAVAALGANKKNAGWYGRWSRLKGTDDD